MKDIVITTWC